MRIEVKHTTHYHYDSPVFPEPHHLYLYPAQRAYVRVLGFDLDIDPQPAGMGTHLDAENNLYAQCWFNQTLTEIQIHVGFSVEVRSFNPFNFLVEEKQPATSILSPYLAGDPIPGQIRDWVLASRKDHMDPLPFVIALNEQIGQEWVHDLRYDQGVLPVVDCFTSKKGSCRDVSWMLIQMLRDQGIAARFVSGYSFNPELGSDHELHAWVEFFQPGAGWIACDPTCGLLADHHYIPICASFDHRNTLPVQGTIRRSAQAQLDFEVQIDRVV